MFGSGAFAWLSGTLQLITARHVVDALRSLTGTLDSLRIPESPDSRRLVRLPLRALAAPQADAETLDADLCALQLAADVAQRALRGWRALTADQLARRDEPGDADPLYLVSGYPACRTRLHRAPALVGLYSVRTRRLAQSPKHALAPVHPKLDLFFAYGYRGVDGRDGHIAGTPPLEGLSGAPVWQLGGGDAFPQALRLVGIQTSYCHGAYIRAKDCALLDRLLPL